MRLVLLALGAVLVLVGIVMFVLYKDTMAGGMKTPEGESGKKLWDLQTRTLEGKDSPLSEYEGKVALVVNVASKCGLTPQYKGLEALYRDKKDDGLVVLAFPSNDFMGQEPGNAEEIRFFCTENYDVTFPMFEKMKVKGEEKSEVYQFLTETGLEDPTWNFTKFLVGKDGKVLARFAPKTAPDATELKTAIDEALARH